MREDPRLNPWTAVLQDLVRVLPVLKQSPWMCYTIGGRAWVEGILLLQEASQPKGAVGFHRCRNPR